MTATTGYLDMVDTTTIEEIPITCEHSRHGADGRHDGDAEWIQQNGPCHCDNPGTAFVCDKWRQWVSDLATVNGWLFCTGCRHIIAAQLMTYTRI